MGNLGSVFLGIVRGLYCSVCQIFTPDFNNTYKANVREYSSGEFHDDKHDQLLTW